MDNETVDKMDNLVQKLHTKKRTGTGGTAIERRYAEVLRDTERIEGRKRKREERGSW